MLRFNGQDINNNDLLMSNGLDINQLWSNGIKVYQRDVNGTSGWLYGNADGTAKTHIVTVDIGISSVLVTGHGTGGTSSGDSSYGGIYDYAVAGCNRCRQVRGRQINGSFDSALTYGDANFPLLITPNTKPSTINPYGIYQRPLCAFNPDPYRPISEWSGLDPSKLIVYTTADYPNAGSYMVYYGLRDAVADTAGLPVVISGAANHTINGASSGIKSPPTDTSQTIGVNKFVVKTFIISVPFGAACKLDW